MILFGLSRQKIAHLTIHLKQVNDAASIAILVNCFFPLLHSPQADHLTRRGKPLPHQESLDIELAEEKPSKRSIITVEELTEIERLEDLDTCMVKQL